MTVHAPIESQTRLQLDAEAMFDRWRGSMLNLFARGEAAIVTAAAEHDWDQKGGMLIAAKVLSGDLKRKQSDALEAFKRDWPKRTLLAHGVRKVWIDDAQGWAARLRTEVARNSDLWVDNVEAEQWRRLLHTVVQQLESRLGD